MTTAIQGIATLLGRNEHDLLEAWIEEQLEAETMRADLIDLDALRAESTEFLDLLIAGMAGAEEQGDGDSFTARTFDDDAFADLRAFLDRISRSRAEAGFSPTETATFVFSFKQPLLALLQRELAGVPETLLADLWQLTVFVDEIGLYTTEQYQASRESIIRRQQQELLELSTPVVKLWDGILALPLIGTLDSARTQQVMENLLGEIVATGSSVAIIDITGVETVDTLVAQHLLKTVAAARLMGAECIISGIRPTIAQMIVQLAIDLTDVSTKATIADALKEAFDRAHLKVGSI